MMKSSAFAMFTVLFVFCGAQAWAVTPDCGVGALVQFQAQGPTLVVGLQQDSPAEQAGIKPGDQIVQVDDEQTAGMEPMEVLKRIRGVAHSRVELTILRPGIAAFAASLVRDSKLDLTASSPASVFQGPVPPPVKGDYGVGALVEFQAQGATPLVAEVQKDSPAEQAGIKPEDQIVAIDGEQTAGMEPMEVVKHIRGVAHSRVELTIARPGVAAFTVSLVRESNLDLTRTAIGLPDQP